MGAGASIEFGAPSTDGLTQTVKAKISADDWMRDCGGDQAYLEIERILANYFQGGAKAVNFEHVYHCAQELLFTFEPTHGAANEFRPLIQPFVERQTDVGETALRQLVDRMAEIIFAELSQISEKPAMSLDPLKAFIVKLRSDYITRFYTTNYDDFVLQAAPDLHTGFDPTPSLDAKTLDRQTVSREIDFDSIFHLHGSIHLSFGPWLSEDTDLGELYWFDNRAMALSRSSFTGTGVRRMDGSLVERTALITGLDKLSGLQRSPFSHYYASMARDAMTADIILVIGCGLGDLHINTWLGEARRKSPKTPLVFVDYWPNNFLAETASDQDPKTIAMLHTLRMLVSDWHGGDECGDGWTLARDRSCAIWDNGFLSFLNTQDRFESVVAELV